jgi:hypothetical protein
MKTWVVSMTVRAPDDYNEDDVRESIDQALDGTLSLSKELDVSLITATERRNVR